MRRAERKKERNVRNKEENKTVISPHPHLPSCHRGRDELPLHTVPRSTHRPHQDVDTELTGAEQLCSGTNTDRLVSPLPSHCPRFLALLADPVVVIAFFIIINSSWPSLSFDRRCRDVFITYLATQRSKLNSMLLLGTWCMWKEKRETVIETNWGKESLPNNLTLFASLFAWSFFRCVLVSCLGAKRRPFTHHHLYFIFSSLPHHCHYITIISSHHHHIITSPSYHHITIISSHHHHIITPPSHHHHTITSPSHHTHSVRGRVCVRWCPAEAVAPLAKVGRWIIIIIIINK